MVLLLIEFPAADFQDYLWAEYYYRGVARLYPGGWSIRPGRGHGLAPSSDGLRRQSYGASSLPGLRIGIAPRRLDA